MQQRNRSVSLSAPMLVLVAVLALVVGSFGSAVAGPITKAQVKKIAKGVVKKNAKHLTVANAKSLAGQSPAAYQDQSTVYTVPVTASATTHDVSIPLTAGSYLVSYSVLMLGGSDFSECFVKRTRGAAAFYTAYDTTYGLGPAASGSGFLDIVAGDTVLLSCFSTTGWKTGVSTPIQIVVTTLDSATNASLPAT
jgi:hypothetical protein